MFGAKRAKQAPQAEVDHNQTDANGYQRVELPTFHGRARKVVVYTSDPQGRIIKKFKR